MRIDWWTLALQAINVLVLVWLLGRFLFRPVADMVEARQTAAAKLLGDASAAKAAAEAEKQKALDEAARIAGTRAQAMEAAAHEAQTAKAALLDSARDGIERMRGEAQAEMQRALASHRAQMDDRASHLAVDITAKLLGRLPDQAKVAGFETGLAAAVAALPEATRTGLGADGAPLRLRAARALSKAESEACRGALAKALGRPVDIVVEASPDLLAGFEVETPHAVVRNNLKADLDRIAAELTHHDSGH